MQTLHDEENASKHLAKAAELGNEDAGTLLERLSKPKNPLASDLLEVADMIKDSPLSLNLRQEANKETDSNTIVKYAELILHEGRLIPATVLISRALNVFKGDLSVLDEYVKLLNIYLYGKYATNQAFTDESLELCNMVLKYIDILRNNSYGDTKSLDVTESNMYFNIGYYYRDKDIDTALNWYSKSDIDLTPNTAQEVFTLHTQNLDQYFDEIYSDVMNLKRALQSEHWHSNHDKSLTYFSLSFIYLNGAPNVPRDLATAYQCIDHACQLDPTNDVYQKEKRRFKFGLFGKISYQ